MTILVRLNQGKADQLARICGSKPMLPGILARSGEYIFLPVPPGARAFSNRPVSEVRRLLSLPVAR